MTMCDGRDDAYGNGRGIKNTVTIDTDRHKGLGGGAGEALFKGRYLPRGCPQTAGAAPLREYRTAAAGRCFRHLRLAAETFSSSVFAKS